MKRSFLFIAGLALPAALSAQTADIDGFAQNTWPDVAAGGGRLFFALVAGILLAFAFQWILTCLSVATGVTAAGRSTRRMRRRSYYPEDRWREEYRRRDHDDREREYDKAGYREDRAERDRLEKDDGEAWEKPVQKIQAGVGAWVLVTASISTFFAAWLAAEMIRFGGRAEAVILGLTVWSGFMFGMMWLEATLIGSLLGNLFGALKNGLRAASAPFQAAAGAAGGAVSASAEEIAAKVREEFRAQGRGGGLKERLKEYMDAMQPRTFEKDRIEREVDDLFDDPEIREAARQGAKVDRRKFQEIVAGRGDLPQDEQRMLVEALQDRWHHAVEESERDRAGAWSPAEAREDSHVAELQSAEGPDIARGGPADRAPEIQKTYSAGPYAASGTSAASSAYGRGSRVAGGAPDFAARFQAFKDFLRSSDKRELNPLRLEQEVESVVIHPEEGHASMERSVRDMKREEVSQVLKQRRDITLEEAESIADLIDAARTRMLSRSEIREHRVQETSDKALARIRDYVYSLKRPEIDLEGFKGDIAKMLDDPKSGLDSLKSRAAGVDKSSLIDAFAAKKGISRQEAERMAEQAEQALKTAEENARRIEEETRRRLESAKRSALEQAEATRKVAASAAWWLFAVAVATAAAAALGGLTGAGT